MRPRDPGEPHRVATPLELLFDLCFVVAVAQASAHLHRGLSDAHWGDAILGYALVFFAIWWAWMNFTWFASAYDADDIPYRLAVLVQIAGVLVLAAGVPRAFEQRDFHVATAGYAIMRIGLVALWLRAAASDRVGRRTAIRYAIGLTLVQLGWLALLALPADRWLAGWLVLGPAELVVPVWAEWHRPISWHPHHIAERFGLPIHFIGGRCFRVHGDSGRGGASIVTPPGLGDRGRDRRPVLRMCGSTSTSRPIPRW
jgi:low temperature requirement protein LtrA